MQITDDDGIVWTVLPDDFLEDNKHKPGHIYSRRQGSLVERPQTAEERDESKRHWEWYEKFMDAAGESWAHLIDALNESLPEGRKASLWQTGGMCLAIGWQLNDEGAYAMLTDQHGPFSQLRTDYVERTDDGKPWGYMLGVYIDDDDDGTESYTIIDVPVSDESKDAELAVAVHAQAQELLGRRLKERAS